MCVREREIMRRATYLENHPVDAGFAESGNKIKQRKRTEINFKNLINQSHT